MGELKEAAAKDDSTWQEHWCSGAKTTYTKQYNYHKPDKLVFFPSSTDYFLRHH
jgi:hypothetical protein